LQGRTLSERQRSPLQTVSFRCPVADPVATNHFRLTGPLRGGNCRHANVAKRATA
jgi:hypothetical protein